jgi:hypothetical protein
MFMCESNKFLRSPSLPPALYLCYFYFHLLVVVGDTRACKSNTVGYRCRDVTFMFVESNLSFGLVQDPQFFFLKLDHWRSGGGSLE